MTDENKEQLVVQPYIAAFVDLLGQAEEMAKIPLFPKDVEITQTQVAIQGSIGAVKKLQENFSEYFTQYARSSHPTSIPPEQIHLYDHMSKIGIKTQRFSDGIVFFTAVNSTTAPQDVFGILAACGVSMIQQFLLKKPVRIGIDIHQGTELRPGEIYGPVVARSYHLESKVAQYPRAVVGGEVVRYLDWIVSNAKDDPISRFNYSLSQDCRSMLLQDFDGNLIIDYLGETFRNKLFMNTDLTKMLLAAYGFVTEQATKWKAERNTKLALRYLALLEYFEERLPEWGIEALKD